MGMGIGTGAVSGAVSGTAIAPGWGTLIGAGVGAVSGWLSQNRQKKENRENAKRQLSMQKELNEQGQALGIDTWNKTNYGAQIKEMKKEGLNVGMMYGGVGAGGNTSTPSGGSAPTIQTSQQANTGLDKGGQLGMMAQEQIELLKAQKENIQADTANKQADIPVKGADVEVKGATKANLEANTAGKGIENRIQGESADAQIETIKSHAQQQIAETEKSIVGSEVSKNTRDSQIYKIKQEAIGSMLQNVATRAGTMLTRTQTEAIADQIQQGYINAFANQRNAGSNETNANTNLHSQIKDAMYKANVIKLGNDKLEQDAVLGIAELLTGKIPTTTETMYRGKNGGIKGSTTQTKK